MTKLCFPPLLLSAALSLALVAAPLCAPAAESAEPAASATPATKATERGIAALTAKLQAQPGFLNIWRDTEKGRVLISVSALDSPFLMSTSLPYALGSNDIGLDRGQIGEVKMVRFEKRGTRLFLLQDNTRFIANSADPDERQGAAQAFAAAVLWSGDILASDGGSHLVDFSSFLLADQHGIGRRLAGAKQGAYRVDDKRSAVLAEQAKSFPDNTELEAELTFQGPGEGALVRRVAADPTALTLRQHVSLVRLPDAGYTPRAYHPASGGNANPVVDFATPLASSIEVRWQRRHRLEKTDPSAALSPVKKPIVYYLDRGAPEPVRSALLDGARWWATAFEKAGFKDAYRVELLPEGVDPMDIRYNMINWVHRAMGFFQTIKDGQVFAFAPPAVLELGNASGFDIDHDGVRHGDVAMQQAAQALGQVGFAAAGQAMDENRAARIHGRPQLVEHGLIDDDVGKAARHIGTGDMQIRHALLRHLARVVGQRDRRRAGVSVARQALARAVMAHFGQVVGQVGIGAAAATGSGFRSSRMT